MSADAAGEVNSSPYFNITEGMSERAGRLLPSINTGLGIGGWASGAELADFILNGGWDDPEDPEQDGHTDSARVSCRLQAEDPRYPLLVLEGAFGIRGYSLNIHTGDLHRVCVCAAHSAGECVCGAWDDDLQWPAGAV